MREKFLAIDNVFFSCVYGFSGIVILRFNIVMSVLLFLGYECQFKKSSQLLGQFFVFLVAYSFGSCFGISGAGLYGVGTLVLVGGVGCFCGRETLPCGGGDAVN